MLEKALYDVTIAGMRLKVRTALSEESVHQLVDLVDGKVKATLKRSKNKSLQKALLLASLNIAEELIALKTQVRKELDRLEGQAIEIVSELESTRIDQLGIGL